MIFNKRNTGLMILLTVCAYSGYAHSAAVVAKKVVSAQKVLVGTVAKKPVLTRPMPVRPNRPVNIVLPKVKQVITQAEIRSLLKNRSGAAGLKKLIGQRMTDIYNEVDFELFPDGVGFNKPSYPFEVVSKSCTTYHYRHGKSLKGKFDGDTSVVFDFDDVNQKSLVTVTLEGQLFGRMKDTYERRIRWFNGKCKRYLKHTAHVKATMDVKIVIPVEIDFINNLDTSTPGNFTVQPLARVLNPQFTAHNIHVSLTGSNPVSAIFHKSFHAAYSVFEFIDTKVFGGDGYKAEFVADTLTDLQNEALDVNAAFLSSVGNGVEFSVNGIDYFTSTLAAEALGRPYLNDFFYDNRYELMYYMLSGDDAGLDAFIAGPTALAACDTFATNASAVNTPLYQLNAGCTAVNADSPLAGGVYSDSSCQNRINYKYSTSLDFCLTIANKAVFGVGVNFPTLPLNTWTLSHGAKLPVSLIPVNNNHQPFMQKVTYKQYVTRKAAPAPARTSATKVRVKCIKGRCTKPRIPTPQTETCSLAMRIYKKDISATNLKPAMVIHAGTFQDRSGTYLGLEAQLSHLTENGFVVFSPFYSLVGDSGTTPACGNKDGKQIVADVNDALTWVQNNGTQYGSSGQKVSLMGQSAGAYLSAYLAVNRANDVSNAMLLYPATDLGLYVSEVREGMHQENGTIDAISQFFGTDISSLTPPAWLQTEIDKHSLPARAISSSTPIPPLYMIHGLRDRKVLANQSIAMCEALSGGTTAALINANDDSASGVYKRSYSCGYRGESRLDLIAQGDHVLDLACFSAVPEDCAAGDETSKANTAASLSQAIDWLSSSRQ